MFKFLRFWTRKQIIQMLPDSLVCFYQRDKEGWPLLTFETEVNGVQMKGVLLGWFISLVVPVQEIFVLSWLLQLAQYKIFYFLHRTLYLFFVFLSPSPCKLSRQSCWVAYVSLVFPS
jgi:hypothetical protein